MVTEFSRAFDSRKRNYSQRISEILIYSCTLYKVVVPVVGLHSERMHTPIGQWTRPKPIKIHCVLFSIYHTDNDSFILKSTHFHMQGCSGTFYETFFSLPNGRFTKPLVDNHPVASHPGPQHPEWARSTTYVISLLMSILWAVAVHNPIVRL